MSKFKDWNTKLIDRQAPEKITKRQIKKFALRKMAGETKKERFKEFFTNSRGYYSWKEMCVNYFILISFVFMLVAGIVCIIFRDKISIWTLMGNPFFICFSTALGFLLIFLFEKISLRKHRFKCFINNGNSNKYVFWKDDKMNPANKGSSRHHSFD